MMVHYLTDPAVASHRLLGTEWSVGGLLEEVAKSNDPPFHALIDGGALVTGMTNLEVARWVGGWADGMLSLRRFGREKQGPGKPRESCGKVHVSFEIGLFFSPHIAIATSKREHPK